MELQGNVILITGGSTGIGLAFAKKLRSLGNEVVVTGRRSAVLDEARRQVSGLRTIQSDVSSVADVEALARTVQADHGDVNVLINNAGVLVPRNCSVPAQDLHELTHEIDINLSGVIRVTSVLIDLLKKNRGTIVNIGSCLAFAPLTSAPVYSATKAAVHSYSTSLRFQLAASGVRVVEVMPPAVQTAMTSHGEADRDMMTAEDLVEVTLAGLRTGRDEIRPGSSNRLHWLSRVAPAFINRRLFHSSEGRIPPG